jgi:hypothetical protein
MKGWRGDTRLASPLPHTSFPHPSTQRCKINNKVTEVTVLETNTSNLPPYPALKEKQTESERGRER